MWKLKTSTDSKSLSIYSVLFIITTACMKKSIKNIWNFGCQNVGEYKSWENEFYAQH